MRIGLLSSLFYGLGPSNPPRPSRDAPVCEAKMDEIMSAVRAQLGAREDAVKQREDAADKAFFAYQDILQLALAGLEDAKNEKLAECLRERANRSINPMRGSNWWRS